jgi:hypothetical protein
MASGDPTEAWAGDSLLRFDGTVVEIFGFPGNESLRFHVRNLDLEIDEPDSKGKRMVTMRPAARGAGGCAFEVDADDWAEAGPLLDRVYEAMPDED